MKVSRFDIFSGTDNNAQWIEVVEGLESASRQIELYAAKCPGKYFVFDCSEHTIAASIDTSPPASMTVESFILMIHELWGFQQHPTVEQHCAGLESSPRTANAHRTVASEVAPD